MNVFAYILSFIWGGLVGATIVYIYSRDVIKDCYRRAEDAELAFVKFVAESHGYTMGSTDTADEYCE